MSENKQPHGLSQLHQDHLLVVQPERDDAEMLRGYFEPQGYKITVAHRGRDALEWAKQRKPDLMISEVILPNPDGYAILHQLRSDPQMDCLPIILLAKEDSERDDKIRALEMGAEDYVARPFDIEELRLRVRNRIRFARQYPTMDRSRTGGRILFVQYIPDVANMLRIYFDSQGYEVLVAGRGGDGLEMCHRHLPDIVVLDVMLPDIDGYSICRHLRSSSSTRHIPIIFLTGCCEQSYIIAGLELGAEDYVTLPFDIIELQWRVFNLIARSRTRCNAG